MRDIDELEPGLTADAGDRFARQRSITAWDQRRLAAATAVVVGVGALGNEVAKNLALLGVGRLILCDPDTVAASNLSRTVLFSDGDIGRSKVGVAAAALTRLAPGIDVVARPDELVRGVGLGELEDAAVVLGCLDSRHARLQLLGRCALAGAGLVDGGTHPWGGEVRVRVDPDEACYGCTLSAALRAENDAPVGCSTLPGAPLPASILSTSLIAAWMTTAAAQLVFGAVPSWRLLEVNGSTGHSHPVKVDRDPCCPHHRPLGGYRRLATDSAAPAVRLLEQLPDGAEPMSWASFPIAGPCDHCGEPHDVDHRHGAAVIPCPGCGQPVRPRRSQRIRDAAPDTPLRDLGVAPEDVLAVRTAEGAFGWVRLSRGRRPTESTSIEPTNIAGPTGST